MNSHLQARFASENGRTRLAHLSASAPLKIAKTFALENGALGVTIMDASPGLLAGDCYALRFDAADKARAEIGTQGFTRVHPQREASRENGCELQTRLSVGADAVLQWFPEPLMLYADADLHAQTTVNLAPTATFLGGDIWCAGRVGRGESWQFARHRNRWHIERAGAPLYASSLDIEPAKFEARQIGAWNNWTHSGNFWAIFPWGAEFDAQLCETFWEIIENPAVYAGASVLANGGVMVSMLGARAYDLQALTRKLRDAAHEFAATVNCGLAL